MRPPDPIDMQPPLAAATFTSPDPHVALQEAIATVNRLLVSAADLTNQAKALQDQLPHILDHFNEEATADHVWVRAVAHTPAQIEAQNAGVPHGSHTWRVVFVGREPGLYTTIKEADHIVRGCPRQQIHTKASKREAMVYYRKMWETQMVEKWVELEDK
ncbi:hypothetical protein DFH08DRAFT_946569 [Mycena albidolilacea]|uniref:Uncharacterized protein n=1 Tax=Mycena albidolilacea TaxID=1033008 RepID=A0AAD7F3J4_9AGAR|nr:hypothetical protein DFH08DRAFT_946569 [Mycena albidolilacea]